MVENGKNITMQWRINKTIGSNINYIWAFAQSQSFKKTQIVTWGGNMPDVYKLGRNIYGDRLETDFADNMFTIKISNTKYNDSAHYSVEVLQLDPFQREVNVTTVNVQGMFFSCFQ